MRAGLAAEFADREALLTALRYLRNNGYRKLDAYTPYPIAELDDILALPRPRLNWAIFVLGMSGAIGAFLLQAWCNAVDYPLNVGGRPPFAWSTNIPITFETGILVSATSGIFMLFWILGLPSLTFPLFKIDGFDRVTIDRFWLAVDATDQRFDATRTRQELADLNAIKAEPFGASP
jgi:hypothetical protein